MERGFSARIVVRENPDDTSEISSAIERRLFNGLAYSRFDYTNYLIIQFQRRLMPGMSIGLRRSRNLAASKQDIP